MENYQVYFTRCIIIVVLPQLVIGDCVFGPNKTDLRALRDDIILEEMNNTLFALTDKAHSHIFLATGFFNLWKYLKINHSVTPENYLYFASMGGLRWINWFKVATLSGIKLTTDFSKEISSHFLIPVFHELQNLAVKYSFSLGVYRPHFPQFNYTGINSVSLSNETFELDLSCRAGSNFVWLLLTDLAPDWDLVTKPEFAMIATATEQAFELYYLNHSVLGKDFVRANVLKSSDSTVFKTIPVPNNRTAVYLELYFINSTYGASVIQNLTNLSEIPAIEIFNKSDKIVNIDPTLYPPTHIPTVSYTTPTLRMTSLFNKSSAGMNETTTSNSLPLLPIRPLNIITSASNIGTSPTVARGSSLTDLTPTLASIAPFALSSLNTPTGNGTAVSSQTLVPTTVPGLSPSNQSSTTLPLGFTTAAIFGPDSSSQANNSTSNMTIPVNFSNLSTMAPTMFSNAQTVQSTAFSRNSLGDSNTVTKDKSNALSSVTYEKANLPSSIVYDKGNTATRQTMLPGNDLNTSGIGNGKHQSTKSGGKSNSSTDGPNNLTGNYPTTGSFFAHNSTSTSPNDVGRSNGTTAKPKGINSSTTFDPDPLFQAAVPVIKKVYNDDFLLRKTGTTAPLTTTEMFYTITIPTSVVIVLIAVICMLCLQIDCLPPKKNNDQIVLLST